MGLLLGVDVGTSGLKALAIDERSGRAVAAATYDYPLATPHAGWAEQDPADFERALGLALRELTAKLGRRAHDVKAIGLTGQMHSAVLLDVAKRPVRPAILWCDTRTTAECDAIRERLGHEGLRRTVGNRALEGFTLPKLLWVRAHEPDTFALVDKVLMPKDWAGYLLTGEIGADASDASGTLVFDPAARAWSEEVIAAFDLPASIFPAVADSPAILGQLTSAMASATGLPAGIPVARGAADNAAGAVGLGVVRPGRAMASIGTSGVVLAHTSGLAIEPEMRLHAFCHAVPGAYYAMGVMLAAGGALRWYRDVLCDGEKLAAELRGADAYEILTDTASTARLGAGGVVFLPYLMGERTPHNDAAARGALVGLTARTTKADVSRAVLEGITFGLCDSLDLIRAASPAAVGARGLRPGEPGYAPEPPFDEIRLTGGGAKSPFWRQMMADVFDVPVAITTSTEGPAFGAAILGGVAAGAFASVEEAADALVHVTARLAPDPVAASRYRAVHAAYRGLYGDLRDRFRALAALE
jgi:xylulokinase